MNEIDEIKNRIDIVDFISGYISLKKAGRNFKAVCPFHNEKTPSFMVSKEKQIWHCFGCDEGGTIFDFVMKMDAMDFPEALRFLAKRANVQLKSYDFSKKDRKAPLYQTNDLSAQFFHKCLLEIPQGKKILDYLKKRGINLKTIKEFKLGYAPNSPDLLVKALLKKDLKEDDLIKSGVAKRQRNRITSMFQGRLMFPITDLQGRTVGFSARSLDDKKMPKYINTPETEIYNKSFILYGFDKAKIEVLKKEEIILVEGNMDVLATYQAEIKNVVASSGTALTEKQLDLVKRFTENIKLAFDVDLAGNNATKRAIELASEKEMNVLIIEIPEGKDPADLLEKDPVKFKKALKEAKYVIDFYFDDVFKRNDPKKVLGKKAITKELLPIIKKIPDSVERSHYLKELSKKLNISEKSLIDALGKTKNNKPVSQKETKELKNNKNGVLILEEIILGITINYPKYLNIIKRNLSKSNFNEKNQAIFSELKKYNQRNFNLETFKKSLPNSKELDILIFKTENRFDNFPEEEIAQELYFCIKRLKRLKLSNIKKELQKEIKEAEKSKDQKKLKKLLDELQIILKKDQSI